MVKILTPSSRQIEWFNRERQIFFHFGMNTFSGREWGDGTENPQSFNPTQLDCRQWIKAIKDAGFTAAVLTAKHHDGFCLWPSKYTEHSIKNSPYKDGKGDIVKEFTDACSEFGIKAGIYLSPWDRHEKTWGTDAYNDFYVNQLTELMTNYGKIWECWWDGAGSEEAVYDWDRWAATVRKYQPDAVIFGSLGAAPYVDVRWVGNEKGIAGNPCWATIDSKSLEGKGAKELNSGKIDGDSFIPAESDVSIRPGWFWHSEQNNEVRSPKNLINLWFCSVGRNSGLLLNLPPDTRGLIYEADVKNLYEFNMILQNTLSENIVDKAKNVIRKDNEIIFEFDDTVTFNTFIISENIEKGHRVTEYEISANTASGWQSLYKGECIGNKWAEHFEKAVADKVKVKILKSFDTPEIKDFGLYMFDEALFLEDASKAVESAHITVERKGDEFIADLGGIYPFNRVVFDGRFVKKYELYIFNGTSYELVMRDTDADVRPICDFDTVDYAYKFKIKILEKTKEIDDIEIEVYNIKKNT